MRFLPFASLLLVLIWVPPQSAHAQLDDDSDPEVEALYDQFDSNEETKSQNKRNKEKKDQRKIEKEIAKVSDLEGLAPFKDVAVIQRRFLPKTKRFELSGHGMISTNNAFFNSMGVTAKAAYYFNEKHGVEFNYTFLTNNKRDVTETLESEQDIATKSLVQPESYMGVAYKWQPVYGKMAFFDNKIVPFDIYFAPGIGLTSTSYGDDAVTLSLATGQLFAMSKSWGIRWDFMWNFYKADIETLDGGSTVQSTSTHSDLFLMIGASFFFPEASYR